jgi:hypothetical protein
MKYSGILSQINNSILNYRYERFAVEVLYQHNNTKSHTAAECYKKSFNALNNALQNPKCAFEKTHNDIQQRLSELNHDLFSAKYANAPMLSLLVCLVQIAIYPLLYIVKIISSEIIYQQHKSQSGYKDILHVLHNPFPLAVDISVDSDETDTDSVIDSESIEDVEVTSPIPSPSVSPRSEVSSSSVHSSSGPVASIPVLDFSGINEHYFPKPEKIKRHPCHSFLVQEIKQNIIIPYQHKYILNCNKTHEQIHYEYNFFMMKHKDFDIEQNPFSCIKMNNKQFLINLKNIKITNYTLYKYTGCSGDTSFLSRVNKLGPLSLTMHHLNRMCHLKNVDLSDYQQEKLIDTLPLSDYLEHFSDKVKQSIVGFPVIIMGDLQMLSLLPNSMKHLRIACELTAEGWNIVEKKINQNTSIHLRIAPAEIAYRQGGEQADYWHPNAVPLRYRPYIKSYQINPEHYKNDHAQSIADTMAFFPNLNKIYISTTQLLTHITADTRAMQFIKEKNITISMYLDDVSSCRSMDSSNLIRQICKNLIVQDISIVHESSCLDYHHQLYRFGA